MSSQYVHTASVNHTGSTHADRRHGTPPMLTTILIYHRSAGKPVRRTTDSKQPQDQLHSKQTDKTYRQTDIQRPDVKTCCLLSDDCRRIDRKQALGTEKQHCVEIAAKASRVTGRELIF